MTSSDDTSTAPPREVGPCESCGSDDLLTEIRRVYVTPQSWDTEGSVKPADDTERWCDACLLHYPHQPLHG